jgi:Family of unknown function (DUF6178)
MTAIRRYESPSSAQLLQHVLERPELVAAVRELPGEALGRLIERVGLEDAGEIVALASTAQLAQVFDHDLWQAAQAGGDEDFQPRRFGLWLHVLAEAGEAFLTERLVALPKELLLLALHRLVLVLDMDALAERWSEPSEELEQTEKALEAGLHEEWEEFRLIAREPESWDVLWAALVTLDRDHHALLRELLERCATLDAEYIEDNGGLYQVLTSEEMLENDVAAERSDRRARVGHVAPSDARAFLALARGERAPMQRDPVTRTYFRELGPTPRNVAVDAPARPPSRALRELTQLLEETPRAPSQAGTKPSLPAARTRPRVGAMPERDVEGQALTRAAPTRTPLERALAELRELEPELAAARLEELAYLANVWIAGGSEAGRKPRPVEALEYVAAVCSDALEHLSVEVSTDATTTAALERGNASPAARILARTACDLLFRRGYAARGQLHLDS